MWTKDNPLIKQLVEFALVSRRGKAFFNYTKEEIEKEVVVSFNGIALTFQVNEVGTVVGLCTTTIDHEDKKIYVRNILTTKKGVLKNFINQVKMMYPGFSLTGHRDGQLVSYKL